MSGPSAVSETPIERREQLVDYLASGARKVEKWKIGTEHEKFGFRLDDLRPPTYEGERGIGAMLKGLIRFGWAPVEEHGNIIALTRGDGSITLEPAGQLELSGGQVDTIHETCREVTGHLKEVKAVADELQLGFFGMGFQPKWKREEMPWMPKGRYAIMRRYMPLKGKLGLDMMTRTCTVQVNLDFSDEADMVKKFRVALALQPVATALFADSPFTEGKPNGYLSYRSHIWTDTDPDRTGMLDFVFEDGFGFERYTDYLLDVPMYFSYRDGQYIDLAGESFRAFMTGKLPQLPGALPTLKDWPALRCDRARCGVGSGQGFHARGTPRVARRRAEAGSEVAGPRRRQSQRDCARSRARGLEDRRRGSCAPQPAQREGRCRNRIPRPADRIRRGEPDAGRAQIGTFPQSVEGQHRSAVRRIRLLTPCARAAGQ